MLLPLRFWAKTLAALRSHSRDQRSRGSRRRGSVVGRGSHDPAPRPRKLMVEQLEPLTMLSTVIVEADAPSYVEGQTVNFTFTLDQPAAKPFQLDLLLTGGPEGPKGYVLPVAKGETSIHVPFPTQDNSTPGDSYTLNLAVTGSSKGGPAGPFDSASALILDDDAWIDGPVANSESETGSTGSTGSSGPSGPTCTCELDMSFSATPSVNEGDTASATVSVTGMDEGSATVTIDWGDGTTETLSLSASGPTGPGDPCDCSGCSGCAGTYEGSHVYVDDNPTNTPADNYTITVTVSSGSESLSGTTTITVSNVDPTVVIESTPNDSVLANGQVDETEGFTVTGRVTDPGVEDTFPVANLLVDLNFDGDTDDEGETVALSLVPAGSGEWTFQVSVAAIPDDGATYDENEQRIWGNETASDQLSITIEIEDDDTGTGSTNESVEVFNIAPTFAGDLNVTYALDGSGYVASITVEGAFIDPGLADWHRVSIQWGDGVMGDGAVNPILLPFGARSFSLTREFESGSEVVLFDLFSIVAMIEDDDCGGDEAEKSMPGASVDAYKIIHNDMNGLLPEDKEESVGAYLPINDDHDKYVKQSEQNTFFGQVDMNRADPISNEDDLLPIVLKEIDLAVPTTYIVHVPAKVRVYQNWDRSGPILDGTEIAADADFSERLLFVEGIEFGSDILRVDFQMALIRFNDIDRIKLNVFQWQGPLNVPDYSIYKYRAYGGSQVAGESKWLSHPTSEVLENRSNEETGLREADLGWNGGPVRGRAVFQAHPDYVWDLNVNVVKIQVESPDEGPTFVGQVPVDDGTFVDAQGVLLKMIKSTPDLAQHDGFYGKAKVTLIGPEGNKGVSYMKVGFMQAAESYRARGYYNNEAMLKSNKEEGLPLRDLANIANDPWYSLQPLHIFFDPLDDAPNNQKTISVNDTPRLGVPLTLDKGGTVDAGDDVLDSTDIKIKFRLNLVVETKDARSLQGANEKHTTRAKANWEFIAMGQVDETTKVWSPDETSGVIVPNAWTDVTDRSRPITSGPTIKQHVDGQEFTP